MEQIKLSGLDKAAILFQVLGDGLAVTMFKDLSDTELRRVRVRAKELTQVSFKLKKAILEEFYFGFMTEKFKESTSESKKPFSFIEQLSDEQVAYLIHGEPPRIAAMVLAQLDPDRQMQVYERLDPDQRIDSLMEMGAIETVNLEAVVSIAGDLREKARFLPKASEFERGGGAKLANMLNRMDPAQADLFLDKLGQENPELLKDVKRHYLTFDDLLGLPDNILRDILNAVEVDDIAVAVKGLEEATVERAIGVLPAKKQAMFEPVEGAIARREVNESRRKIMQEARKLQEAGEFNLEDLLSGDIVE